MSFRSKHRWTRKILVGLAFGLLVVAPAQAAAGPGHDDSAVAATAQQATDPYLTDIPSRPLANDASGPDGAATVSSAPLDSWGPATAATSTEVVTTALRPDDRADRFTVTRSDLETAPFDDGFTVEWQDGITIGLGALATALVLGIAVAVLRRPRVAL